MEHMALAEIDALRISGTGNCMIHKPLDAIEVADIEALIDGAVAEGRTIDYKQELPGRDDASIKEFLADVVSFANAAGGDLVFGMSEALDEQSRNTGLPASMSPIAIANVDAERLRLENRLRDGVAPRIPGVGLRFVEIESGQYVLILRIPRSWAAPHQRSFKASHVFYSRNSAGKYPLDISELRSAFVGAHGVTERLRAFRIDRLGKVEDVLASERYFVLHVLPLSASDGAPAVDVRTLFNRYGEFFPRGGSAEGWSRRFNFDGVLTYGSLQGSVVSYTQAFRTGAFETASSDPFFVRSGTLYFDADVFGLMTLTSLARTTRELERLGIVPPFMIGVSLVGAARSVLSTRFSESQPILELEPKEFDRNELLAPDVLMVDRSQSLEEVMRPAFDAIWQGAGWHRCVHYDESGNLRNRGAFFSV